MKLISWNVNGIRAIYKKGLFDFVRSEDPDIFCVQETKANPEQLEPELVHILARRGYWSAAERRGYSGVATFAKFDVPHVEMGIGISEFDTEGRFVITRHPLFTLYNVYFPNGSSGPVRHEYKMRFLSDFTSYLRPRVEANEPIVVVGDYNVARSEIDVYDPVRLANTSGFLPEERQWFAKYLAIGFVDTFRHFHPDAQHRYTWWSYMDKARMGNRGWRIDYICVTENLVNRIQRADILDGIEGSDHCPLMLELE